MRYGIAAGDGRESSGHGGAVVERKEEEEEEVESAAVMRFSPEIIFIVALCGLH